MSHISKLVFPPPSPKISPPSFKLHHTDPSAFVITATSTLCLHAEAACEERMERKKKEAIMNSHSTLNVSQRKLGYGQSMGRTPVHRRATQRVAGQITMHTLIHTKGQFRETN
ncbi:hypothetical protein AMECASPLE_019561 [Ameca splendens]|uniref:Uncharacterized protein n=1 Tax=Ameca splendens TaxID=208324 RepID=A0ABV0ZDQ8_9TELE